MQKRSTEETQEEPLTSKFKKTEFNRQKPKVFTPNKDLLFPQTIIIMMRNNH